CGAQSARRGVDACGSSGQSRPVPREGHLGRAVLEHPGAEVALGQLDPAALPRALAGAALDPDRLALEDADELVEGKDGPGHLTRLGVDGGRGAPLGTDRVEADLSHPTGCCWLELRRALRPETHLSPGDLTCTQLLHGEGAACRSGRGQP